VALRPRGSAADLLSAEVVERLASSYASYLPVDLVVETAGGPVIAAGRRFPWEGGGRDAALSLGEVVVGARPLDVVDLSDPVSGVRGQAFVLPHPTGTRGGHRLYAKRMLVGESVPDVLPDWAFFVRAVLDTERLALTASRESLADDDVLGQTRARLGDQLKRWLLRMARTDRARAQEFFGVHHLGQVAAIARAEDIAVLNAGYAYDRTILERWVARTDGLEAVRLEPEHLADRFSDPDPDEAAAFAPLLDVARQVLGRSEVRPVVRSFRPATMHAVLLVGRDAHRERDRRDVAAAVDDPWSAALAEIAEPDAVARFVLNAEHHAVRRLADCGDAELQRVALEALYAHALLAGRHPLTPFDSALVARALPALIDRAVDGGPA